MSPLRKIKKLYHKEHKGNSQRTQIAVKQVVFFMSFVLVLCSLWLKILFGVASLL